MINPEANRSIRLGAVLLAAGASSRMGRPKMLLRWGKTTVLGHLIHQWQSAPAEQMAVVCAAGDPVLSSELDRLGFPRQERIPNPHAARGMFSSIQAAAAWPGWDTGLSHWAIVLGDQPQLSIKTLTRLIAFARTAPDQICQPSLNGRPKHPVILPRCLFQRLVHSTEASLKFFLQNSGNRIALCEMQDPGLDCDLDTPADYEAALRQFAPDRVSTATAV